MAKPESSELLSIDGREVRVTHPEKVYFAQARITKLDLVRYYLSVAPGALAGIRDRPVVLKRFVNGAEAPAFYQKRAPEPRPEWLRTVTLSFPSGRTAEEVVVDDAAGLAWVVNLGCIELHPHPVRSGDLDHPDELRIDLDPVPGVAWDSVRKVALEVKVFLDELGLRGWPKTSGSRGMHVNVRIEPRWTFAEVRRAAVALSRAVERRLPALASSKWWKEERHGVFLDYNQNAKDRTTCSAYSVRPLPDARVSTPLHGRKFLIAIPRASPCSPSRSASQRLATRTRIWILLQARSKRCSIWPRAMNPPDSLTRPGRRIFARWKAKAREWRRHARSQQSQPLRSRPRPHHERRSRARRCR